MLVRKGTFIFSCKKRRKLPVVFDKCTICKDVKECKTYASMLKMANELEQDLRDEQMMINMDRGY